MLKSLLPYAVLGWILGITMVLLLTPAKAHDCYLQAEPNGNCWFESQYDYNTGETVSVYVCE